MLPSLTPPGSIDLTGVSAARRRKLQHDGMAVLAAAGYEEAITPTCEYEEIFLRAGGPEVAERLVRLVDRDGRILALRYDFTASIARVAATACAGTAAPLRLSYTGPVFRQEPERGGRARETLQLGAELIGVADLPGDIEILRLTLALARAAGLREFQVNLGHVGALAPGLEALAPERREEVRRWIDRKDRASLTRAVAGESAPARALASLAFVIGRRPALEAALRSAPATAHPALAHLLAIDAALSAEERTHLVYDLGEVRGLDYYTGIHFELFVAGAGRAAGAGGRYDGLVGRYGADRPAVGIALDLDTVADARDGSRP
jgi:ATP phosphoribosyltransferase regulatory subunit